MARLEGTGPKGAGINEQKVNDEGEALAKKIKDKKLDCLFTT